ncbi:hypothetical protein D3C76_1039460 [compost metagenome]
MVIEAVAQLIGRDLGRSTFGPMQITHAEASGLQGDDLQVLVMTGADFEAWQVADFTSVGHRRGMGHLDLAHALAAAVVAITFDVVGTAFTLDQHHTVELVAAIPFQCLARA